MQITIRLSSENLTKEKINEVVNFFLREENFWREHGIKEIEVELKKD